MNTDSKKRMRFMPFGRRGRNVFIIAGVLALVLGSFLHHHYTRPSPASPPGRLLPKPPVRQSFQGVTYSTTTDNQQVLTIRADAINVGKGKIGFLRFGLLKEAVIDNGRIEIHDNHAAELLVSNNSSNTGGTESIGPSGLPKMPGKSIFSNDMLASLAVGDVKALRIKPIEVTFYANARPIWRISAKRAEVKHRPRRIVFTERVEIWQTKGVTQTRKLTWNLETGVFDWPERSAGKGLGQTTHQKDGSR